MSARIGSGIGIAAGVGVSPNSHPLHSPAAPAALRFKTAGFGRALGRTLCVNTGAQGDTAESVAKQFQHLLLPVIDKNPYLSDGTRQAAAAATAIANKYGAKITVVVIDEEKKEGDYETRLQTIRWHLGQGGFQEYGMLERIGDGKPPAVIIGEIADDMGLDLVVLSMECIHAKRIDGNLLGEFVPCPLLLLPL